MTDRENEKPRGHPEYDKLGKIRWLIDHLLKKFPEYKFPEKNQTVDEQSNEVFWTCRFFTVQRSETGLSWIEIVGTVRC